MKMTTNLKGIGRGGICMRSFQIASYMREGGLRVDLAYSVKWEQIVVVESNCLV